MRACICALSALTCLATLMLLYTKGCSVKPKRVVYYDEEPNQVKPPAPTPGPCGSVEDCLPPRGSFTALDLDYIETHILADLISLEANDQINTRYGVVAHTYNRRLDESWVADFAKGVDKGVNSISFDRQIRKGRFVDPNKTIMAYNLDELDRDAADWELIADNEPFNFISNTSRGVLIRDLTGADQPWLHGDNLLFTSGGIAGVYNKLMELERVLEQETIDLGVEFQEEIDQFEAYFMGQTSSPISYKNRLVMRMESADGYYWQTCDPEVAIDNGNLSEFPLIVEALPVAGRQGAFDCFASMFIASLPNRMQLYALYANVTQPDFLVSTALGGVIQEKAPIEIVIDNTPGAFDPEIENGFVDCGKCHSAGLTGQYVGPPVDFIKPHIERNAAQFDREDVDKILGTGGRNGLYKTQEENLEIYRIDDELHQDALRQLDIDPFSYDPVNLFTNEFRSDYDLNKFCSWVITMASGGYDLQDCIDLINSSAVAREQLGQLLDEDVATLETIIDVFPDLIIDFRLGQDPVGG